MSYVMAAPEMIAAAATDVAAVGSTVSAAHMAAAPPTIAVIPAAADEVSASIAQLFSRCAQDYHALAGQAAAFQSAVCAALGLRLRGRMRPLDFASAAALQPAASVSAASNVSPIATTLTNYVESYVNILQQIGTILALIAYEIAFLAG